MFTNDYGETFTSVSKNEIIGYGSGGVPIMVNADTNYALFLMGNNQQNNYTLLFTLDKRLNILNKVVIDSLTIMNIRNTGVNGALIAIGLERRYPKSETGNEFHINKYYILYSYDYGITWEKDFEIEFEKGIVSAELINNKYWISSGYWIDENDYQSFINVVDPVKKEYRKKVFTLDKMNAYRFYLVDDVLYLATLNNWVSNENYESDYSDWKVSEMADYSMVTPFNEDYKARYVMTTDLGTNYKRLKKILRNKPDKVEEIVSAAYLYSYPPYPNPARNEVKAEIFWEPTNDINSFELAVYDIMGAKVAGRDKISLAPGKPWQGTLTWNCGNVPSGIYFIRISGAGASKTVPVVVSK